MEGTLENSQMRQCEEDRSRLAAFFYSQRNRNNDNNENSWQRMERQLGESEEVLAGTFYLPGESFVCVFLRSSLPFSLPPVPQSLRASHLCLPPPPPPPLPYFSLSLFLSQLKEIISLSGNPFPWVSLSDRYSALYAVYGTKVKWSPQRVMPHYKYNFSLSAIKYYILCKVMIYH